MFREIDWFAIITALTAVYGAVLSTYIFKKNRSDQKRRISLKLSLGFLTGEGVGASPTMLLINISNPGNRTVRLGLPQIKIKGSSKSFLFTNPQSNVTFPHELTEGNNCMVWKDAQELARQLSKEGFKGKQKLTAVIFDLAGTSYNSKKFVFNIDDWLS